MQAATSYSEARKNLKTVLDQVCHDREPMLITRKKGGNVVLLAEEEYQALEETAYLLRAPANARRLLEAVDRDRKGIAGRSLDSVLSDLGWED